MVADHYNFRIYEELNPCPTLLTGQLCTHRPHGDEMQTIPEKFVVMTKISLLWSEVLLW